MFFDQMSGSVRNSSVSENCFEILRPNLQTLAQKVLFEIITQNVKLLLENFLIIGLEVGKIFLFPVGIIQFTVSH